MQPRNRSVVLSVTMLAVLAVSATAQEPGFVDVAGDSPLSTYRAGAGDDHGPGGVFTDLDNDGFPDLVLVGGPAERLGVYRNLPGSSPGRRVFELMALPARPAGSTGAVAGDFDNDGDLDLYVLRHPKNSAALPAPNELWRNLWIETGTLAFSRLAEAATDPTPPGDRQLGLARARFQGETLELSLTAAAADVDRDGDLDVYVGNHDQSYLFGNPTVEAAGQRDVLYLNNGDGTFTDYTLEAGATGFEGRDGAPCAGEGERRQCYSSTNAVVFADLDNDRWPDLVVTNKMNNPGIDADMLYVNLGADADGRWLGFENRAYEMSAFGHHDGLAQGTHNAMGVDAGDFDNDGDLDLYVTDADCVRRQDGELVAGCLPGPNNNLLVNQLIENGGTLDFLDLTDGFAGELGADFSWGVQWLDADNDGRLDLHVATAGAAVIDALLSDFLFVQEAGVLTNRSRALGVDQVADARGDLAADYDRDGAVDLFVVNLRDVDRKPMASRLYENQLPAGTAQRHFLSLRLVSHPRLPPAPFKSTRDALGARVTVSVADGAVPPQVREVVAGGGNAASTASLDLEFGLGPARRARVDVAWPSGRDSTYTVDADQFLTISEQGLPEGEVIGAVGQVEVGSAPVEVPFGRSFTRPVVFAQPPSFKGPAASIVRIIEVRPDGFTVRIQEAPDLDGRHPRESVSWLVLEVGQWQLADGTRLEVGTLETSATVGFGGWEIVTLSRALGERHPLVPMVLTQVQTASQASWVKTRQRRAAARRFQVGLDTHEAASAPHGRETVGWLAMEPSRGLWSGLFYAAGRSREDVNQDFRQVDFGQGLGVAPRLLAALATTNDRESSSLRFRNLASGGVEVKVEEDRTRDGEARHGSEAVSYLVFGGDGLLSAAPFVPNRRPSAELSVACEALTCTFDASAASDDAEVPGYGYAWIFGDSRAGNGREAVHTYPRPGSYQVRLTVTDRSGQTTSTLRTIEVDP